MTDAVTSTESAAAPAAPASNGANSGSLQATAAPVTVSADAGAHAAMAQALVDGGHWTPQQAADALAADGQPDEDQAQADNAFTTALDHQTAIADLRSTLDAAGVDASEAGGVASLVEAGLKRAPTPEQNAAESVEVRTMLQGVHGKEKAGYLIAWAQREFQQMAAANPNLRQLAERSGAGNNISLLTALAKRGWQRHVEATIGKAGKA
jgi:hypothetical protein